MKQHGGRRRGPPPSASRAVRPDRGEIRQRLQGQLSASNAQLQRLRQSNRAAAAKHASASSKGAEREQRYTTQRGQMSMELAKLINEKQQLATQLQIAEQRLKTVLDAMQTSERECASLQAAVDQARAQEGSNSQKLRELQETEVQLKAQVQAMKHSLVEAKAMALQWTLALDFATDYQNDLILNQDLKLSA